MGGIYADVGNRLLLYKLAEGASTKRIKIPSLLRLPHLLANFILEQPQTCSKTFLEVSLLSLGDEMGVMADKFHLVTSWLIVAFHRATGAAIKSKLGLTMTAATSMDLSFHEWAAQHIVCTYGLRRTHQH